MNKRKLSKIVLIASIIASSVSFIGCNAANKMANDTKNAVKEGTNDTKNAIEKGKEDLKNTTEEVKKKFDETETKYTKDQFIKDLKAKGFDPKVSKEENNNSKNKNMKIFSVNKEVIKIKGGELSLYEYGPNEKGTLEKDMNSITNSGANINGNPMTWNVKPHFYRKGRVLIVYDGDSKEILTSLKEILGDPII